MNDISKTASWMKGMFDDASARYVLSNTILTFGLDGRWRQSVVENVHPKSTDRILDICTGTADLVLRLAKKFPQSEIYALDFSHKMLANAKRRAKDLKIENIIFIECDCTNMGLSSNHFDYITISFGFRNLSYSEGNLKEALKEIYRVLKYGWRFIILETSQPDSVFIKSLFHLYAARIVPRIGELLSGQRSPYAYLGRSIVKFFDENKLSDILVSGGFKREKVISFMFGAIRLCVFQK